MNKEVKKTWTSTNNNTDSRIIRATKPDKNQNDIDNRGEKYNENSRKYMKKEERKIKENEENDNSKK